jgi:hypothetical protein
MINGVNCQHLLFTETWRHSNFGLNLCKIRWGKHYRAFVKVVEGSGIYNFAIHHFVHFYSKLWKKSWPNRSSREEFLPERGVAPAGALGAPASRRTADPRPQACDAARGRASLGCGPPETGTHAKAPWESTLSRSTSRYARTSGLARPCPRYPTAIRAAARGCLPLCPSWLHGGELHL